MRTVLLTFDDGFKSHFNFVAPLLKSYGFNGTFFICRAFVNGPNYVTENDIVALDKLNFEIGNHFYTHANLSKRTDAVLRAGIKLIEDDFKSLGIAKPVSFCPPGFQFHDGVIKTVLELGYKYVRIGILERYDRYWIKRRELRRKTFHWQVSGFKGPKYQINNPLVICSVAGSEYGISDAKACVDELEDNEAKCFCFHNFVKVRNTAVDWLFDDFIQLIEYLKRNDIRVISLRDQLN